MHRTTTDKGTKRNRVRLVWISWVWSVALRAARTFRNCIVEISRSCSSVSVGRWANMASTRSMSKSLSTNQDSAGAGGNKLRHQENQHGDEEAKEDYDRLDVMQPSTFNLLLNFRKSAASPPAASLRTLTATTFELPPALLGCVRAKSTWTSCSGLGAPSDDAEHVTTSRVILCLRSCRVRALHSA